MNPDKTEVLLLNMEARRALDEECGDPSFFFGSARTPHPARYLCVQLRADLTTGDMSAVTARERSMFVSTSSEGIH